jgi:ubiquinone/menaquinone biosynthesis C-methylase UbiE
MAELQRANVDVFDHDANNNDGYLYTHTDRLSCRLATSRSTDIILGTGEFHGRSILDVACGDAFYTIRFFDLGSPARLVAADAAVSGVAVGARHSQKRPIRFLAADAHRLPFADNSFDMVLVQSVLHHDDNPLDMIKEAFRIAPKILIHEPNGNNFGLKIIEMTSPYHIEHNEKSYTTRRMRRWIEEAGGRIVYQKLAGFVPMFCPDWMARAMKLAEPVIESIPLCRALACSVYVMVAERK